MMVTTSQPWTTSSGEAISGNNARREATHNIRSRAIVMAYAKGVPARHALAVGLGFAVVALLI
jgi:hypothetical protein